MKVLVKLDLTQEITKKNRVFRINVRIRHKHSSLQSECLIKPKQSGSNMPGTLTFTLAKGGGVHKNYAVDEYDHQNFRDARNSIACMTYADDQCMKIMKHANLFPSSDRNIPCGSCPYSSGHHRRAVCCKWRYTHGPRCQCNTVSDIGVYCNEVCACTLCYKSRCHPLKQNNEQCRGDQCSFES